MLRLFLMTPLTAVCIATAPPSTACLAGLVISPISYDMLNGGTGQYSYWDESYNGSGNNAMDYAQLSGGLGDLTDGVRANQNWFSTPALYVGWLDRNPTITFNFDGNVLIETVTLYLDDADGVGSVEAPESITLGGLGTFNVPEPAGIAPFAFTISGLSFSGSSLDITLNAKNRWVMLSEVAFADSSAVPEPSSFCLGFLGVAGVGFVRFRRL